MNSVLTELLWLVSGAKSQLGLPLLWRRLPTSYVAAASRRGMKRDSGFQGRSNIPRAKPI